MTDNLKLNNTWVVYKLHFSPSLVQHFKLVYQNPFIKIYQCNNEFAESSLEELSQEVPPPLFDERLFKQLSPHNTGKYWKNIVVGYYYVKAAERLFAQGKSDQAERMFEQSVGIIPTFEGYNGLGRIYQERHDDERAAQMFAIARSLWHK